MKKFEYINCRFFRSLKLRLKNKTYTVYQNKPKHTWHFYVFDNIGSYYDEDYNIDFDSISRTNSI